MGHARPYVVVAAVGLVLAACGSPAPSERTSATEDQPLVTQYTGHCLVNETSPGHYKEFGYCARTNANDPGMCDIQAAASCDRTSTFGTLFHNCGYIDGYECVMTH